ncbi:MAG TPA: hypothetical protein VKY57_00015 [Chitinispirillaceae bacterium]|nr:hypothetical protein [Chitinispirillaceae bacterium]
MKNKITLLLSFLLVTTSSLQSAMPTEKHLSLLKLGLLVLQGEQEGVYEKGDYVVVDNVIIPQGDTMTILGGSRIHFCKGRIIRVRGTLICDGDKDNPVTIVDAPFKVGKLSLIDSILTGGAACINLYSNGSLKLRNTQIKDTTLSLISERNFDSITFDSTVFASKSNSNITIGDSTVTLPCSKPVSFNIKTGEYPFVPEEPKPVLIPEISTDNKTEKIKRKWIWPARILSFALTGAGAAAWYHYNGEMERYADLYYKSKDPQTVSRYHKKNHDASRLRNLGIAAAVTGTTSFSITFFIRGAHK